MLTTLELFIHQTVGKAAFIWLRHRHQRLHSVGVNVTRHILDGLGSIHDVFMLRPAIE